MVHLLPEAHQSHREAFKRPTELSTLPRRGELPDGLPAFAGPSTSLMYYSYHRGDDGDMPEIGSIRKLLFWRTKSPFTDRWDVEITYEDKRKERRLSVTSAGAAALVKAAIERTESEGKKVKP
jgi:hypothetical protein